MYSLWLYISIKHSCLSPLIYCAGQQMLIWNSTFTAKRGSMVRLVPFVCRCIWIPFSLYEFVILCFLNSFSRFLDRHSMLDPKLRFHVEHRDVVLVFVKPFLMFRVCDVYLFQIVRVLFANLNQNILWVDTTRPTW